MTATIKIPVSIFTFPFKAVFVLLTSVLGLAILASGIGAVVAAFTGGFGKQYQVVGHGRTPARGVDGCLMSAAKWEVKITPGWAAKLFGSRSKVVTVYNGGGPQNLWFDAKGQPISPVLRSVIEFHKFIGKAL